MFKREHWATRLGFILAAIGSAVGLGNIWRFPFQVGQEGGAAFLIVYLFFVCLIGFPAILVEFVIGRGSNRDPIDAFKKIGHKKWKFAGAIGVLAGFVIMAFYSVVGGWVLRYAGASITGAYFAEPAVYFSSISTGYGALFFHALFMLCVGGIVYLGVKRGIELAVKFMVPSIVALLGLLGIYASTLSGAMEGYTWYLSPDFSMLFQNWTSILPAAAGQAFFTLSLGMGALITYSSYMDKDDNMAVDGASIVGADTFIAVLVGFVVFPIIFTMGATPGQGGPGELFVGLGGAIAELPFAAHIFGLLFFLAIFIAAVSSSISIVETIVSYLMDHFHIDRKIASVGVSLLIFLAGIPVALDMNWLTVLDDFAALVLLPLGMFLLVLFVGWFYEDATEELSKGIKHEKLVKAWIWHVRIPILIVIAILLFLNFNSYLAEYAGLDLIAYMLG